MDEVKLRQVTFSELSELRHEILVSQAEAIETRAFLILRFSGVYRAGGKGRPDALYIVAAVTAAKAAWYSKAVILDFGELDYRWGDEMEWIRGIGWNSVIGLPDPLVVVVERNAKQP